MIKAVCCVKLIEKRSSEELTELLGFEEALNGLAKTNKTRWHRHVLRVKDDVLTRALDFEVVGRRKRERTKMA